MGHNHACTIYLKDFEFLVYYSWYRAVPGAREKGTGIQLEPDEPETYEVDSIKLISNNDLSELYNCYPTYDDLVKVILENLAEG